MTSQATAPTTTPSGPDRDESRMTIRDVARRRSVWVLAAAWIAAFGAILVIGIDGMPDVIVKSTAAETVAFQLTLMAAYLLFIGVVVWLTRRRAAIDFNERVGTAATSRREVAMLLTYVVIGLVVGAQLGFGLHPEGAVYGPIEATTPGELLSWAGFNLIVFGLVPYLWIRSRGYTTRQLGLRGANLRADIRLILIVLGIEAIQELTVFTGLFDLSPTQLAIGMPLSFVIHLAGTGIPIMICIYAILLPRYQQLTGSITTSTILGGLTYAAFHITEYWTTFDTTQLTVVSVILVFTQFTGPGMIKSILTLRTGNAWVHLWAYHAIVPHVTVDTPNIVETFEIG